PALGRLHVAGIDMGWSSFHAHESRHRVVLPTYPFERQRYWIDADYNSFLQTMTEVTQPRPAHEDAPARIYTPGWKQSPVLPDTRTNQFDWIVFTDRSSLSERIVARLRDEEANPLCIAEGVALDSCAAGSYVQDPSRGDN